MELSIRFDPASGVPAVRQITDNIRILLVEGKLAAGAVLPSVRRLAMELGVHFNTVAGAYRELAEEGWLALKHGQVATVVARPVPETPRNDWAADFGDRIRSLVARHRSEGVPPESLAEELRAIAKAISR